MKEWVLFMKTKAKATKHTDEFYKKKYAEYREGVKGISKDRILSFNEYKAGYMMKSEEQKRLYEKGKVSSPYKNITKELIDESKYRTSYRTALKELQVSRELGLNYKLSDLRNMSTQEFAKANNGRLKKKYADLKASGLMGAEAAALISKEWFGSN